METFPFHSVIHEKVGYVCMLIVIPLVSFSCYFVFSLQNVSICSQYGKVKLFAVYWR